MFIELSIGIYQGTYAYSYDDRYHLTGDGLSGGATTSSSTWAVDPASEITATSYTLNAGVPVTTTRIYNAGDELLTYVQAQGATTQHSYTLGYDPPGNRRSQVDTLPGGPTTTYGYDQADRLTRWAQGTSSATYRYDGDGLRQSKTVGATTTQFTWDVGAGLPLLLGDGTAQYLYGPGGLLLEQVQGTTPYYYHSDRLGSVRALTDGIGAVQDSYAYDDYGTTTSTGTVVNPFGYTGQYQDSESGLYYLRARYYDPATQQFLSVDPLAALTGQPYNYANGSPVNGTDPNGLLCDPAYSGPTCYAEEVAGYRGAGGSGGYKVVNTDRGPVFLYPGDAGYESGILEAESGPTGGSTSVGGGAASSSTGVCQATFGTATSKDYKSTFFVANPGLDGNVVVHHAVEQQTLRRFPAVVSWQEIHSIENLRGIPNGINPTIHLSAIRKIWNSFYKANPNPTQAQLLEQATEIDQLFGHLFLPPIR